MTLGNVRCWGWGWLGVSNISAVPSRPAPAPRALSRKERAEQTRQRMIRAAYDLFLDRGYEATTMQDVATSAGVAVQTTYYTFKTKSQLLAEVEALAVLGDRPTSEWRDSPLVDRVRNAATVADLVKDFVAGDSAIKARLAPFVIAVGAALPADPGTVARREAGREGFFRLFIDRLAEMEALRPGVTAARALDILLVVDSLPAFIELTTQRGWTPEQWQDWLIYTIETQFLDSKDRTPNA